jgi:CarD family transcriptional regulator
MARFSSGSVNITAAIEQNVLRRYIRVKLFILFYGGIKMFNSGDYVVCPGHGVGQVCNIEVKEMNGAEKSYYIVKIVTNGMKIMVPTDSKEGLRTLVKDEEVQDVFELLQNHDVKVDTSTWNRRHRDYMNKVKTGSLLEIADVLRSLLLLKVSKKLSFGERKMLDQCKELIVKEIALTTGKNENDISGRIDGFFD